MNMDGKLSAIQIIVAASGIGAPDQRCGLGPEAVMAALGRQGQIIKPLSSGGLAVFESFVAQLANATAALLSDEQRIAILSGDHSCAIGSWRGVSRALNGSLGLIWIDAHMDAHTLETSPSGFWHGMPVAALLGQGALGRAGAVIRPENLCLLGVRSFEVPEATLLQQLGVRVISMDEVNSMGLAAAMAEAQVIAKAGTEGYGLSIDLDGLNLADAPAVGSPVVGGIRAAELLPLLAGLLLDTQFRALEVAEFNPANDVEHRTLKLVVQMLNLMSGAAYEPNH
jgi:arginase